MADYHSPATAAAAHAAAVPLSPSPSPSPSPTPSAQIAMNAASSNSPSPQPPWALRPDNTGGSTGHSAGSSSPQASRFSINRANSGRSSRGGSGFQGRSGAGGGGYGRRHSRASFSRGRGRRRAGGFRGAVASATSTAGTLWRWGVASGNHVLAFYIRLSPLHRILFLLAGAVSFTLGILMLVYSHRIFAALGPMAKGWHDMRGGWVLVWLLVFITGFPPIIGYSTACTLAGLVYGFPWGWPIAASANVIGSLAAFVASRTVLSRYVDRLVGSDHRFVALSQVLRHDGLWVLAAVRFCPLPYSLSNGFLATIPSITPLSFALSTAMASPKLLVHVFIGSRLAKLAEDGDSMSAGDKVLNYFSMAVFGCVGVGVGLFIFRRTMARAAEIAAEEGQQEEGRAAGGLGQTNRAPGVYADNDADVDVDDDNAPLMDPEDADVAALMDDDDISLWAADHFADGDGGADASDDASAPSSTKNNKNHSRVGSYHDDSDGEQSGRKSTGKR
ncbi:Tlg2-vesicle protein [Sporothrix curviconia]|uniref:Golgi apparatus membrane protein TVP38 n=1 Tax=Sporothrix curviconia TaxID=1260050 RepID=A0ABP0C0H4_9PEZI